MTNQEKHPRLLPVDAPGFPGLEPATPLRWESVAPRLIESAGGGELLRMSRVADEYARRKEVALALSRRDLTPLFEAFPGHPFLKHFADLYRCADDEQRAALLEGVGATLLEFAHWKGWLQHLAVPPVRLEMADILPDGDASKPPVVHDAHPEETAAHAPRPDVWNKSRRQKMSRNMKQRSKDLAAAHFGVKPADFWTSAEFAEKAGLPEWKFEEMKKDGTITFPPLRGPKGYSLLWRKTDVSAFMQKLAQQKPKPNSNPPGSRA
jgi:hypothetical protein